jgi:hypothetical protein
VLVRAGAGICERTAEPRAAAASKPDFLEPIFGVAGFTLTGGLARPGKRGLGDSLALAGPADVGPRDQFSAGNDIQRIGWPAAQLQAAVVPGGSQPLPGVLAKATLLGVIPETQYVTTLDGVYIAYHGRRPGGCGVAV